VGHRGAISGDLALFDADGTPLAEIAGVRFQRLSRETLGRLTAGTGADSGAPPDDVAGLRALLAEASGAPLAGLLADFLRTQMSAILGLEAGEIELDQPITGLADSLMLAELKGRIEAALEIDVGIEVLFEQPSLGALAAWIAAQLDGAAPDDGDDELLAELVDELDGLSDEDALACLQHEASGDLSPQRSRG
jgi:acyl carrier protein